MLVLASVVQNDWFSYSSILELLGHGGIHEGQWVNRSLKLWGTRVDAHATRFLVKPYSH